MDTLDTFNESAIDQFIDDEAIKYQLRAAGNSLFTDDGCDFERIAKAHPICKKEPPFCPADDDHVRMMTNKPCPPPCPPPCDDDEECEDWPYDGPRIEIRKASDTEDALDSMEDDEEIEDVEYATDEVEDDDDFNEYEDMDIDEDDVELDDEDLFSDELDDLDLESDALADEYLEDDPEGDELEDEAEEELDDEIADEEEEDEF